MEDEDFEETPYWMCPYMARWHSWEGHDPTATCGFDCWDEPKCVTFGPWSDEQYQEAITSLAIGPNPMTPSPSTPAGSPRPED